MSFFRQPLFPRPLFRQPHLPRPRYSSASGASPTSWAGPALGAAALGGTMMGGAMLPGAGQAAASYHPAAAAYPAPYLPAPIRARPVVSPTARATPALVPQGQPYAVLNPAAREPYRPFLQAAGATGAMRAFPATGSSQYLQAQRVANPYSLAPDPATGVGRFSWGPAPQPYTDISQLAQTKSGAYFSHGGKLYDPAGRHVGFRNPVWMTPKGQVIRADTVDLAGKSYGNTRFMRGHQDLTFDGAGENSLDMDPAKVLEYFNRTQDQATYLHGGNLHIQRDATGRPQRFVGDGRNLGAIYGEGFRTQHYPANREIRDELRSDIDPATGGFRAPTLREGEGSQTGGTGAGTQTDLGLHTGGDLGLGGAAGGGARPALNHVLGTGFGGGFGAKA